MNRKILIAGLFTVMMLVITFSSSAEQAIFVNPGEAKSLNEELNADI